MNYNSLSFIVIGRNEGIFLKKCFESIQGIVKEKSLSTVEIIYVDSGSTDDSVSIAVEYATKVISLEGEFNAAVARNVGAQNSEGDFLIFLDGDMELQLDFFKLIYSETMTPIYDFVNGDIFNIYYNSSMQFISEGHFHRKKLIKDEYMPRTGGFFCIKRKLWNDVGGMREKYRRSQDLDFGFRLAKKGKLILRKKELAVRHNTISYFDKNRMSRMLLKNDFGYRGMLYRDHLFNPYIYKMLIRTDYTLILLIISSLLSIVFGNIFLMFIYLFIVMIRALIQTSSDKNSKLLKLISIILKDSQVLIAFFLFFPKGKKSYKIRINK